MKAIKTTEAVKRKKEIRLAVTRLRKSQTGIIEMYGRAREQYVYPLPAAMMNFSTKTVQSIAMNIQYTAKNYN